MSKKKTTKAKQNQKRKAQGKPKGQPPAALRKNQVKRAIKNGETKRVPIHSRKAKPKRERVKAPPPREVGLLDVIGEVMSECEVLAEEMRTWADGMPENQQGGQKHTDIEQAADTLEEAVQNDPVTGDTMLFLNDIKLTVQDPKPRRRGYSRAMRLGFELDKLREVMTRLEEYEPDHPNERERADLKDVALQLHSELEETEGLLEGVEFPGMYG